MCESLLEYLEKERLEKANALLEELSLVYQKAISSLLDNDVDNFYDCMIKADKITEKL